jgi:hypothetical protein
MGLCCKNSCDVAKIVLVLYVFCIYICYTKAFVMAYRYNERNAGHWTLDGEPKQRRTRKPKGLSEDEKALAKEILLRVYECMEREEIGFVDGGRFMLCLDRDQMWTLRETIEKL